MNKLTYGLLLGLTLAAFASCGGGEDATSAQAERTYTKVRGVVSYRRTFGDLNDLHLAAATRRGIRPIEDREAAEQQTDRLLRVVPNGYFALDSLTHSIPYLVPSASVLLTKIGRNFQDSLYNKGLDPHRIIVTSVLRTRHDVRRLRRRNYNASENSAHFYGTTFDVSYRRFEPVDPDAPIARDEKLKMVLAEVLRDLRQKEWCYVKYEVKQGCFHITTRL